MTAVFKYYVSPFLLSILCCCFVCSIADVRVNVTSASLPFTRSWGRKTGFKKFIENSSFDQNQKFLRYFAQHETKMRKKFLGVIGTLTSPD